MKKNKITASVILAIVLIAGASYLAFEKERTRRESIPEPSAYSPAGFIPEKMRAEVRAQLLTATTTQTADWKLYINDKYGYSILVPPSLKYGDYDVARKFVEQSPTTEEDYMLFHDVSEPGNDEISRFAIELIKPNFMRADFAPNCESLPDKDRDCIQISLDGVKAYKWEAKDFEEFEGERWKKIRYDVIRGKAYQSIYIKASERSYDLFEKVIQTIKFVDLGE